MRYFISALIAIVLMFIGLFLWANRYPEMPANTPVAAGSFDKTAINKGSTLVAIGACVVCHTKPGGQSFAGGREIPTPFGTIYSTNITPDMDTGIGSWSLPAFTRALRQGVDRYGNYLYPAFPYDHFTKITDEDIAAIYAYLMSAAPVKAPNIKTQLPFPFNMRILLAGWNLLFLREGAYLPDKTHDDQWNRGAYLVEAVGHCGACHTPRNFLGAERHSDAFSGETLEGWHAPALNKASPAPVPWTADAIVNFLLDGWDGDHGIAAGTMTPVVNGLGGLSDDDAYSIAAYILSFQDQTNVDARTKAAKAFADKVAFSQSSPTPLSTGGNITDPGAATFTRVCANCHRAGTNTAPLALSSVVNGPDPRNLIHIIDEGIVPPQNAQDHSMPAFRGALSEGDLANLVAFVRSHFSTQPTWSNVPEAINEIRSSQP